MDLSTFSELLSDAFYQVLLEDVNDTDPRSLAKKAFAEALRKAKEFQEIEQASRPVRRWTPRKKEGEAYPSDRPQPRLTLAQVLRRLQRLARSEKLDEDTRRRLTRLIRDVEAAVSAQPEEVKKELGYDPVSQITAALLEGNEWGPLHEAVNDVVAGRGRTGDEG